MSSPTGTVVLMGLKRRTPLGRSRRAKLIAPDRAALVAKILQARPRCERCRDAASVDCHELLSRARGGSILDAKNIAALCRSCHDWVTTHPKLATEEGFLLSRLSVVVGSLATPQDRRQPREAPAVKERTVPEGQR